MKGNLTSEQIEALLRKQVVGHLDRNDNDQIYVVPISYAYDGQHIYCHTQEGMKLRIMRKNPKVCFQVDEFKNMANWRSVITWGKFEELEKGKEKDEALQCCFTVHFPLSQVVPPIWVRNGRSYQTISMILKGSYFV